MFFFRQMLRGFSSLFGSLKIQYKPRIAQTLGIAFFFFLSSGFIQADILQDSPSFSTSNQSLWGPGSGITELKFKTDFVDTKDAGTLGGILDAKIDNTKATKQGDLQLFCPDSSFFDIDSGNCFECPDGYTHNPLLPATDSNVCTTLTNQTPATLSLDPPQFLCPAGQFPDVLSGQCYSCPSGYTHNPAQSANSSGVCFKINKDTMDLQRTIGCDAGEFDGLNGRCYTCPTGYIKDTVGNGCHKVNKDTMDFQRTTGCDAGEFDGLNGSCYTCPTGYSPNLLRTGCEKSDSAKMLFQRSINPSCSGGFENGLTGDCYSCPSGYSHDPLKSVFTSGVCYKDTNTTMSNVGSRSCHTITGICILDSDWTYTGTVSGSGGLWSGNSFYLCPTGYTKTLVPFNFSGICTKRDNKTASYTGPKTCDAGELTSGSSCYECQSGYDHDITVPFNNTGICKQFSTASRSYAGTFRKCEFGELESGGSCYECPTGFNHDISVPFNNAGICTQTLTTSSNDAGEFRSCDTLGGELTVGSNCYECPAGFNHDPFVSFNNDGICFNINNEVASVGDELGFLCPAGQFFDVATSGCFSCDDEQLHDPLKGANQNGVCYNIAQSLPDNTGTPQLLCPSGQFADIITGACYTCPDDYVWNPLVPVSENGVCFNLQVGTDLVDPDFQAGIQADYDFDIRWGLSGGVLLDGGSVNIDYKPNVEFEFYEDFSHSGEGRMFILGSKQNKLTSDLSMNTTVPGLDVFIDTHIDAKASLIADVAFPGISELGAFKQERHTLNLMDIDTLGEQTPDPENPLVSASVKLSGMSLDVLGNNIINISPGVFNYPLTIPLSGAPKTPKGTDGASVEPPITLDYVLAEFSLSVPNITTPVDDNCKTLLKCFIEINGVEALTNTDYFGVHDSILTLGSGAEDTVIENFIRSGNRTSASFLDLNGTLRITDILKVEVDIDGLVTLATGVPLGINFGATLDVIGNSKDSTSNSEENPFAIEFFSISANVVDLDVADIVGLDVSFSFNPNLMVEYDFGRPVMVQIGTAALTEKTVVELPLGESLSFIHPGDRLHIKTAYSMTQNRFTNDIDLMVTPLVEGEILSGNWSFIGMPPSFPSAFAAAKATLAPDPIKILDLNFLDSSDKAVFALNGFLPESGPVIFIQGDTLPDSDGDGMPNEYEIRFGLDPDDPDDGEDFADFDGDGVSNIDEYLSGDNPAKDELPPSLSAPADIQVAASGKLTRVLLGTPSALDNLDGELSATPDNPGPFTSGRHIITWTTTDSSGNNASAIQLVDVLPLVNLTPSSITAEGETVSIKITLSGPPPAYPVIVPYTVSGTSSNPEDHNANSGELVISSGLTNIIDINIVSDEISESPETLVVTLGIPVNAVAGNTAERSIEIVEANIAPEVELNVSQGGIKGQTVAINSGNIIVTADVEDKNSSDLHTYQWSSDTLLIDSDDIESSFTFNPATLPAGIYILKLEVADNGSPVQQTSTSIAIRLLPSLPVLSASVDTDKDGTPDAEEGTGDSDGDGIPNYKDNLNEPNQVPASEDDNTRTVESDVGTKIRLGAVSLLTGKAAIGISEEDILNAGGIRDVDFNFPSGLYDFKLSGKLPGDVYNLVIPLVNPIPANASYRKYIADVGWFNFVENSSNRLSSALSVSGSCPAIGNPAYSPGLTEGDDCLLMSIKDGGANDADSVANGEISDPGGISTPVATTPEPTDPGSGDTGETSTSDGGGGLFYLHWWVWMLGFISLLLSRRYK